jgi:CRISPR/Cas system CMR-associated protein Cmr5 small subunit
MTMQIDEYGNKEWYNASGELHRDNDLPAIEYKSGDKEWYVNGKYHRDNDLPAIEYPGGSKEWYVNGLRHRVNDLPAIEYADGDKEWWVNGENHRDNDLPAIEYVIGYKVWYENGKRHRLGGLPAIRNVYSRHWYINDKKYTYEKVCNYYKIFKNFGRYCLRKIRIRKLRRVRWIHGELLCMPVKGSYPGGQDYHKMVSYFMSM